MNRTRTALGQTARARRQLLQALPGLAAVLGLAPLGMAARAQGQAAAVSSPAPTAQPSGTTTRQFSGKAVDQATGQWLYTEQHQQTYQGERWLAGRIRYVSPQGQLIAEKTLDFSQDPFVPLTRMRQPGVAYEEAITQVTPETVTMETVQDGQRKTEEVRRPPVLAADSGFHSFVQAHLDELVAGKTVALAFGVVSQRSSFRFRVRKTELSTQGGQTLVRLLAEPDSLLRLLAEPLTLVYDVQTRDLVEYRGLSNLVDEQTRKTPKVHIRYSFGR